METRNYATAVNGKKSEGVILKVLKQVQETTQKGENWCKDVPLLKFLKIKEGVQSFTERARWQR